MKKTLFLSLLMATALSASAMPVKKGLKKPILLDNGTTVLAELRGDEFRSYWQTDDGKCFSKDAATGVFHEIDAASFKPSNKRLQLQAATLKDKSIKLRSNRAKKRLGVSSEGYFGERRGVIILAQFKDLKFNKSHTSAYYQNLANQEGFTSIYGHVGSVRDYFIDQSNGQFVLDFDVYGPVTLPNNYAYYGAHTGSGSEEENDAHAGTMVAQACKLAAEAFDIDFKQYDWDGDGTVDQVFVIYAGQGEADGGDDNTIWPHQYYLSYSDYGSSVSVGGANVDKYACGNEQATSQIYNAATGKYRTTVVANGIGTICHEFSHCLGFPDMYDTTYKNYGMGSWDLLDQGSYNGKNSKGYQPPCFTGYERMSAGWVEPIVLSEPTTVKGLKPISQYGSVFIVYNDENKDEYYLLENRQQDGIWDGALPGSGLMITHVDYSELMWSRNCVNTIVNYSDTYGEAYAKYDNDHQRCTIFHADNTTYAEETDLYPNNGNNALTSTSTPAAIVYTTKGFMNKDITNIVQNEDGTIDFDFMGGSDTNVITGIGQAAIETEAASRIYTLDGRYAGNNINALGHGIYVRGGKKIVK